LCASPPIENYSLKKKIERQETTGPEQYAPAGIEFITPAGF